MISERELARGFGSFWMELLPLLTPSVVTVFNAKYVERVPDTTALDREEDFGMIDRADFLAEFAFRLAAGGHADGVSASTALVLPELRETAWKIAGLEVARYRGQAEPEDRQLSDLETRYVTAMLARYDAFESQYVSAEIEYCVRLPGMGFLAGMETDISAERTLFEVKTVTRNFGSKDLRQLFVYLAIDYIAGDRRWSHAGLFNPRAATSAVFEPPKLLEYLSAGQSASTVYARIADFLDSRQPRDDRDF